MCLFSLAHKTTWKLCAKTSKWRQSKTYVAGCDSMYPAQQTQMFQRATASTIRVCRRRHIPLIYSYLHNELHGATSRQTSDWTLTASRTSNLSSKGWTHNKDKRSLCSNALTLSVQTSLKLFRLNVMAIYGMSKPTYQLVKFEKCKHTVCATPSGVTWLVNMYKNTFLTIKPTKCTNFSNLFLK